MEWINTFWDSVVVNQTFSMFMAIFSIILPIIWRMHDKKRDKKEYGTVKEELNKIIRNQQEFFKKICYYVKQFVSPKTADDWWNDAEKALDNKEYDKAIKCFRRGLKIEPKASVYNSLGLVYEQKRDYGSAIKCFEVGIKLCLNDSWNALMYLNMGSAYRGKEQLEEAVECLEKALALPEIDIEIKKTIFFGLGTLYSDLLNYPKVIDYLVPFLNQHSDSDPEDITHAYYVLGKAYRAMQNDNDSQECFLQAIKSGINDVEVLFYIGCVLAEMGNYEKAMECLVKALDAGYDSDLVYLYLGLVYSHCETAETDKLAKECFKKITGIYKTPWFLSPAGINAQMGYAYYAIDEYDKTIEYSQKAIDCGGRSAFIYCNIGLAYGRKGACVSRVFYDSAILYLRKAIKLDPDCMEAYCGMGFALLYKGLFMTKDSVMGITYIQYAEKLGSLQAREFLENNRELVLNASKFDVGQCFGVENESISAGTGHFPPATPLSQTL